MKRIFVVCFDPASIDQLVFHNFLNRTPMLVNWRGIGLPGAVLVVSRLDIKGIGEVFRQHFNSRNFFVSETSTNSVEGWLPRDVWQFLADPPEIPPVQSPPSPSLLDVFKDLEIK